MDAIFCYAGIDEAYVKVALTPKARNPGPTREFFNQRSAQARRPPAEEWHEEDLCGERFCVAVIAKP